MELQERAELALVIGDEAGLRGDGIVRTVTREYSGGGVRLREVEARQPGYVETESLRTCAVCDRTEWAGVMSAWGTQDHQAGRGTAGIGRDRIVETVTPSATWPLGATSL